MTGWGFFSLPRVRAFALLTWACVQACVQACGGSGDSGPVEMPVTVDGRTCQAPAKCDIAQTSCADAVLALTACVRGETTPPPPKVHAISQAAYRKQLQADVQSMGVNSAPWDGAFVALHLVSASTPLLDASVDVQATSVAAYYDDKARDITIIESNTPDDPVAAMYELSHELTHYLQDRAVGLARLEAAATTTDAQAALSGLVEGEAVANSTRVLIAMTGHSTDGFDFDGFYAQLQEQTVGDVEQSATPLILSVLELPYGFGGQKVERIWQSSGRAVVDALFDSPPQAFVDFLAPNGVGPGAASRVEPLACAPPLAPDGYELGAVDSLGAAGLVALLAAAGQPELTYAAELRGDLVAAYVRPGEDDASLSAWRLRFPDAAAARAVASAATSLGLNAQLFDSELLITGMRDEGASNPLLNQGPSDCPQPRDLQPTMPSGAKMMASLRRVRR